jgi:hypothetical protein
MKNVLGAAMSRKLACAVVILTIGLPALSQDAYASCGPRVIVTTSTLERALLVGKWQAKVANTIGDLYSDWHYATGKRLSCAGTKCMASAIPCDSR